MAVSVGTNFDYRAKKFLDDRLNIPKTEDDLKNWNIPVPEAFELPVNGTWYIYSSSQWNEETGHWEKRSAGILGDTNLEDIERRLQELMNYIFKLNIAATGGGNFELGSKQTPSITWTITRENAELGEITEYSISGSSERDTKTLSGNVISFTGASEISEKTIYTVSGKTSKGQSFTNSVTYNFLLKKYYGSSAKSELTDAADILKLSSDWASSKSLSEKTINCSGGKYIYYVLPASIYGSGVAMKVGGLDNSDVTVSDITFKNSSGYEASYKVVKLNNIQNGSAIKVVFS